MMTSLMILRRRDHLFDQRADDDDVRDNVSVVVDVVVAGEVPDRDLLAATATHGPLVLLFSALKGWFVAASGNVSVNCEWYN